MAPAGQLRMQWNGADDSGRRLPAGLYFARGRWRGESVSARLVRID
jgi:hypothetical protein